MGDKPAVDRWESEWGQLIEPGVRALVRFLHANRFDTVSSCEGGRGHQHKRPNVSMQPHPRAVDRTRQRLTRTLLRGGYRNFEISTALFYDHRGKVEMCFVEVDFFDPKPVLPLAPRRRS